MTILITIQDLGINSYSTNQYAIVNIYILAKDGQRLEIITYIGYKVYLGEEFKANILVNTDIIMP